MSELPDLDELDEKGFTILYRACYRRDYSKAQELIGCDADVNKECKNGYTALHIACMNYDYEIVRLLLQNGADPDHMTHDGDDAFSLARNSPTISMMLIKHKHNDYHHDDDFGSKSQKRHNN